MKRSVAIMFVACSMMLGCGDRYTQVPIASTAAVSKEWTEIRPLRPLHWTQPVEELSFHIDSPHDIGPHAEILGPGGEKVVPDVELVASDGKTYTMDEHGFWGEDMFFSRDKLSDSVAIQVIRIRSRLPLHISNLIWRGYDPAKVKR